MGWETEVIIIGEGIESKDLCIKIGNDIFEKDSKRYGKENFYIASSNLGYSIYYTYERSKYAPYSSFAPSKTRHFREKKQHVNQGYPLVLLYI